MLAKEPGVHSGSDIYFFSASTLARKGLIYLYACGNFHCNLRYKVERYNYHNYLLMYVNHGICGVETDGKKYEAKEGEIIILDCHKPHCYYSITDMEILWVHFEGKAVGDIFKIITKNHGHIFPNHSSYCVYSEIQKLLSECRNNQPMIEAVFSWRIYRILCEFVNKPLSEKPFIKNNSISFLMDFIQSKYGEKITLKSMSKITQLSSYHLSRVFKKHTGFSPYEFMIITRINNAKHLLKTTDMLIKEVAFSVGFNSEVNFTNLFTARVGLSPQKFRKYPF